AEAALGAATKERHLAAFEECAEKLGAGGGVLALAATAAGLAVARARPAADALLLLELGDARLNGFQVHQRVTPRSRCTSSRVRNSIRPAMVAFTRLSGLV